MRILLVLRIVAVCALATAIVVCPMVLYWSLTDPVFKREMERFIHQNFWLFNAGVAVWWQLAILNLFIH